MKDIINGLLLGCIQNKAILISMLIGKLGRVSHVNRGIWKERTDNYDIQEREVH